MQRARSERELKQIRRERDAAEAERDTAQVALQMVTAETRKAKLAPEQHAIVKVRAACTGSRKGLTDQQRNVSRQAALQLSNAMLVRSGRQLPCRVHSAPIKQQVMMQHGVMIVEFIDTEQTGAPPSPPSECGSPAMGMQSHHP